MLRILDIAARWVSWLTMAALVVLTVWRHAPGWPPLPEWTSGRLIAVLTAAAVGYLTNWIAIWLLFKPYERRLGFLQGVIPRKRAELGRELGVVIPEYLLKPEELADQISELVRDYLQDPALLSEAREKVNLVLTRYSGTIAAFLIPYIEDALRQAV